MCIPIRVAGKVLVCCWWGMPLNELSGYSKISFLLNGVHGDNTNNGDARLLVFSEDDFSL
jgi:hypothetical protein